MNHNYDLLTRDIHFTKAVIDFFTAQTSNPSKFEEIKKACIERLGDNINRDTHKIIENGFISRHDLLLYLGQNVQKYDYDEYITNLVIKRLLEHHLIEAFWDGASLESFSKRFRATNKSRFFSEADLILNLVAGWPYIIDKYSSSVVKIENKNSDGDYDIGTGFSHIGTYAGKKRSLIITNKHVLENGSIKVFSRDDQLIEFERFLVHANKDIGIIIPRGSFFSTSLILNPSVHILDDVITIGYPSVPMTSEAFQLCHKGEINSFVKDREKNELILIDAKTSSGNSGSPVIDNYGLVVGIVTEELFEPDKFAKKGKLPYYAVIPSKDIIVAINDIFSIQ